MLLENELKFMKKDFQEIKKDVIVSIEKLDNQLYRDILFLCYVCFENWRDIAETLGYFIAHIYRLHRQGLDKLNKLIKKR